MKSLSLLFFFLMCSILSSASVSFGIDSSRIDRWLGEWEGKLNIYNSGGLSQSIDMGIKHFKTDSNDVFGWYLIYGEDKDKGTRAYYLNTIDEEKGHYQVDEKNTIFLDSYLIGNKMISTFEVEGSLINSIYTLLEDGRMMFEIIYANTEEAKQSGDQLFEGEEIPLVNSYFTGGYQQAILDRKLP